MRRGGASMHGDRSTTGFVAVAAHTERRGSRRGASNRGRAHSRDGGPSVQTPAGQGKNGRRKRPPAGMPEPRLRAGCGQAWGKTCPAIALNCCPMTTTIETRFSPRRTYRLDLDAPLAIEGLLRTRMAELNLKPSALVAAAGYRNINKGLRAWEALRCGHLSACKVLAERLPHVLAVPAEEIERVLQDTHYVLAARIDRALRLEFTPHVVWICEHARPTSITLAAFCNAPARLRFEPENLDRPAEFSSQAVRNDPGMVPFFGRTTGFFVNYSPDVAVEFDLDGEPQGVLDRCVTVGRARMSVGGRVLALR